MKFILGAIYPILAILLLSNLKYCNTEVIDHQPNLIAGDVVRQAERTGNSGDLKITLQWDFQGDIDLHVKQPNGKVIYYKKPKDSSTRGFLDVDNQNGGNGAAENIYWENPPKGEYSVSLVYFNPSKSTSIAESGTCSVVVFQQGNEPRIYKVYMKNVNDKKKCSKNKS